MGRSKSTKTAATAEAQPDRRWSVVVQDLPVELLDEDEENAPQGPPGPASSAAPPAESPAAGLVIKSEVFVLNPEEVELLDKIAAREGCDGKQRLRDALMIAVRRCAEG